VILSAVLFFEANASQGLVAYWSFDSVAQKTYYDVTGHGFDAVGIGESLGITGGISGNALDCRGGGFDIVVKNSMGKFALAKFSVEAWVYSKVDLVNVGSFYNYRSIFDNSLTGLSGSGVRGGYSMGIDDRGVPYGGTSNFNGSDWILCWSDSTMSFGKWYHLVSTFDSAIMKMYVNGVLKGQTLYGGGIKPTPINARIGCQYQVFDALGETGATRNWFVGKIDELKLFDYTLSADTIQAHYMNGAKLSLVNFGMPTVYASPGEDVWIPIYLSNKDTTFKISTCDLTCVIDTSLVSFVAATSKNGIWNKWLLSTANNSKNTIHLLMSETRAGKSWTAGEIVRCKFHVNRDARIDNSASISFKSIILNETINPVGTKRDGTIIITGSTKVKNNMLGLEKGFQFQQTPTSLVFQNIGHLQGSISLFDVSGRLVFTKGFSSEQFTLNVPLRCLPAGVYFSTVRMGKTAVASSVIVR
jgi:hypothetical protein